MRAIGFPDGVLGRLSPDVKKVFDGWQLRADALRRGALALDPVLNVRRIEDEKRTHRPSVVIDSLKRMLSRKSSS